jgi:hypothetical protein
VPPARDPTFRVDYLSVCVCVLDAKGMKIGWLILGYKWAIYWIEWKQNNYIIWHLSGGLVLPAGANYLALLGAKCTKIKWSEKYFKTSLFCDILSYLDHNSRNSRIGVQWLNGMLFQVYFTNPFNKCIGCTEMWPEMCKKGCTPYIYICGNFLPFGHQTTPDNARRFQTMPDDTRREAQTPDEKRRHQMMPDDTRQHQTILDDVG